MTAKDFIAIADALKSARKATQPVLIDSLSICEEYDEGYEDGHTVTADAVVDRVAGVLAASNPRFDRDLFVAACK